MLVVHSSETADHPTEREIYNRCFLCCRLASGSFNSRSERVLSQKLFNCFFESHHLHPNSTPRIQDVHLSLSISHSIYLIQTPLNPHSLSSPLPSSSQPPSPTPFPSPSASKPANQPQHAAAHLTPPPTPETARTQHTTTTSKTPLPVAQPTHTRTIIMRALTFLFLGRIRSFR